MGLGKSQRLAKFEVAGFIYYGNRRKFVFKNLDKPIRGNPLFWGKTDFTVGFADPMFPIQCQTLWSYDYSKWVIFTKNRILQWKIVHFGNL